MENRKIRSRLIWGFIGLFSITGIIGFLRKEGLEAAIFIKSMLGHAIQA